MLWLGSSLIGRLGRSGFFWVGRVRIRERGGIGGPGQERWMI